MKNIKIKIFTNKIKINRNELSGAFGDIGTDLPLIVAMLLASDFKITNVLIMFGLMQILTGLIYGIPMAVQPLKVVALIVITQKVSSNIVMVSGLLIGIIMFILSITNLLTYLEKIIPKTVIRGIQLGLGMQLGLIALKDYLPSEQITGYILAVISFTIALILLGNKKYPPAIFIILFGIFYTIIFKNNINLFKLSVPHFVIPTLKLENLWTAFFLLTLPQIPLSLGNSIYATKQIVKDLYPEKSLTVKKIGITYSIMNLLSSLLGGIPVCHGSGGLAGHHTFGGRTGGSVFIYGLLYVFLGLIFSTNFFYTIQIFPKSILGTILLIEGISLMVLVKDIITDKKMFFLAILIALLANGVKYGYVVGLVAGIFIYNLLDKTFLKHYGKQ